MTTYPPRPDAKMPKVIADHGRQITRAHARLDQAESTSSKHTADIAANTASTATNTTDIATQTTDLTALDTRLGGSTQETYLSTLAKATAPSNPAHTGIGTVGHIGGAPTQSDFNNLVDDYNATNSCVNNLVDTVATLLSRLGASNILT